jgi:glycosyltransferase involved in cell wall biosynthesis
MSAVLTRFGCQPRYVKGLSRELKVSDVATVFRIYKVLRDYRPDIVHTHTAKAGAVGRLAVFLYKWFTLGIVLGRPRMCHAIHTFHGHVFSGYSSSSWSAFFVRLEQFFARFVTDRIIVLNQAQFQEIHVKYGIGRARQFVISPLGTDLKRLSEPTRTRSDLRSSLGIGKSDFVVGIVGRLVPIKNHQLFLEAAARLLSAERANDAPPHIKFVIIGNGQLREGLEARAAKQDLSGSVIFTGNREDPENFYQMLDLCVLSSNNEGTPLCLIEAMACGVPVISTDVGGVVDLMGDFEKDLDDSHRVREHKYGLLVPPNDVLALARAIQVLARRAELRSKLAFGARAYALRQFDRGRLVDEISTLYSSLRKIEA